MRIGGFLKMNKHTLLKRNAINLVRHHRRYCEGEKCNISLLLIADLLREAGIKLTKKQLKEFA